MRAMRGAVLAAAAWVIVGGPASAAAPAALRVERVVMVMRHGVRPPTKAPPLPAGTARGDWPAWAVPPGWLTPHGAEAMRLLGKADRAALAAAGSVPARGCPTGVRIVADSDQRTIATAEVWAKALAPGCRLAVEHPPQDAPDPLFAVAAADPAATETAVLAAAGPGGLATLDARMRPTLHRLEAALCGDPVPGGCGVGGTATSLVVGADGRPRLAGALDRGSTAAQILLLEYADGKPIAEVGWGRADAALIEDASRLHALEFALVARPLPVARARLARLAPLIRDALTASGGPAVTVIVGHDNNVAALAGLLGAHWHVPGYAADDPAPGGALILERVVDRQGRRFVRARYRAQPLAATRSLAAQPGLSQTVGIGRCSAAAACPTAEAAALIAP